MLFGKNMRKWPKFRPKEKGLKKSLVLNLIKDYNVKAVTTAPVKSMIFSPTSSPRAVIAALKAAAVVVGLVPF
jgi:hypothetical protein